MRIILAIITVLILAGPAVLLAQDAVQADEFAAKKKPSLDVASREGESWWRNRHQAKLKEKEALEQVDLVMIGDSITHSWENAGKETWEKYYSSRSALNLGFSGDRTEHVIWRLQNGEVEFISPKLCVLMIGTNNTGHRKDKSEDTAAGIKTILEELKTRLPNTKVLLLGVFPRGDKTTNQLRMLNDGVNEIIRIYADQEHVWFLNINDHFLDSDGVLSRDIMPDLLHPNAKGYEIWAEAMEPMLKQLLDE